MSLRNFGAVIVLIFVLHINTVRNQEDEGVKYANKCESTNFIPLSLWYRLYFTDKFILSPSACKILAIELDNRLRETGKTSDVLEIGYSLDDVKPKKKMEYRKSYVQ